MIELIFTKSGAGSLKISKRTGDKSSFCDMDEGLDRVDIRQLEETASEARSGSMIDGDVSEIADIWLMGDVGDISDLPNWGSRLKIMQQISQDNKSESDKWIEQEEKHAKIQVSRLQNAARCGEPVRVWWSDIASETCGYYWAMSILKDSKGPVYSVKVPRLWPTLYGCKTITGTKELSSEEFGYC